jgi:hypothetical protein
MQQIGSTYKAVEVEETLDIYFYRPLGYLIAKLFYFLRLQPTVATILSIIIGVGSAHLFYYRDFTINAIGVALFIFADILDSADGQLARMMNIRSLYGRILDGVGGNLIFFSVYVHICLRVMAEGGTPLVWVLALAAGICHSVQSGLADYYRNAYMRFVVSPAKGEMDSRQWIREEYDKLHWDRNFFQKVLMRVYLNYTTEQEAFSKGFLRLKQKIQETFGETYPPSFSEEYRRLNKPLLKYYSMLAVNLRVIVLCISVLVDFPTLYLWFELTYLNIVAFLLIRTQEKRNQEMVRWIDRHAAATAEGRTSPQLAQGL